MDKLMERSSLRLVNSSFWLKAGPCLLECEKKDLTHAIGSTFGGIISSELIGDFCHIKVELDVQKPLRRGIFILAGSQQNLWVPFKYENLPGFCFGCGRMAHGIKECNDTLADFKELLEDDLPFSLALKAESNLMGKDKRWTTIKDNLGIKEVETNLDSPLSQSNLKEKDKDKIWFENKFRGVDKDEYKDKVIYSKN
ncbi:hypothetical protein Gogos_019127 [Gossypium gossypioides]|uniref:Zinc knuckle CX2CX4HX4C domain-containing protein n=1 Tax=Gossypium gossypioides TaxID=34282 RepID=A0A7J9BGF5_GOSGO|nr:hypothetical protein [Gossypium gossypioides]